MDERENIIEREYHKRLEKAKEYLIIAERLFSANEIARALDYYNFAINNNPSNSDVYCNRAECFYSLKDNKYFIRDLTYAITTNKGRDVKYWQKRADGYYRIGDHSNAEKDKEKILLLIEKEGETPIKIEREKSEINIIDVPNASLAKMMEEKKVEEKKIEKIIEHEKDNQDIGLKSFSNLNKADRIFLNLKGANYSEIYKVYMEEFSEIREEKVNSFEKILKKTPLVIDNSDLLTVYAYKNGQVNFAKVFESLKRIEKLIDGKELEVYDWGDGKAFSSTIFFDFIKKQEITAKISKLTIIDPSPLINTRQKAHLKGMNVNCRIQTINKDYKDLAINDFEPNEQILKLHFFVNLLDRDDVNIKDLAKFFENFHGTNLIICVSDFNDNFDQLDAFYNILNKNGACRLIINNENTNRKNKWRTAKCPSPKCAEHSNDNHLCRNKPWTRKEVIFISSDR